MILTILVAALAVVCFLINPLVIQPQKDAIAKANADAKAEVEERNRQAEAEYKARISELESQANQPVNPSWPSHKTEGWDLLDLTTIPLENQTAEARTRADLMTGGTFTVSNLGNMGIESFTPVINPPQTAILGVDTVAPKVRPAKDGGFEFYQSMGLSLTCDHRVIDGTPSAKFLKALCENLENFEILLAK